MIYYIYYLYMIDIYYEPRSSTRYTCVQDTRDFGHTSQDKT